MKFTSILAIFAFTQASNAKDISCVRNKNGVECFDETSLQDTLTDEIILSNCTVDESNLNIRFDKLDIDKDGIVTWNEYYG